MLPFWREGTARKRGCARLMSNDFQAARGSVRTATAFGGYAYSARNLWGVPKACAPEIKELGHPGSAMLRG